MANKKKEKGETRPSVAELKRKKISKEKEEAELKRESKKEQIKQENKLLRNFLIGIVVIALVAVLIIVLYNSINDFNYHGVEFETVKFCDSGPPCLVTYKTTLPVRVRGENVSLSYPSQKTHDYNFYLRSDPRDLEVDFNAEIIFKPIMVLNSEEDFTCGGNGAIAAANLNLLYKILGTQVISDANATCDALGRYTLINIVAGNETKIEHFFPACYTITIKDCEILEGTEKFMIETFVKVNEEIKGK
jgi:hypothetical protein